MNKYMLLDDFENEYSSVGTSWEGFTDQVMGGVSEMSVLKIDDPSGNYIRMSGNVSLENNGGFIQIRLKLAGSFSVFDGSEYDGLRLKIRGEGNGYYLFLKTSATILPWQFYKAKISLTDEWSTIEIPWNQFEKGDYGRIMRFRSDKLKSIALSAYGEDFRALVELSEIGFYKNN